MKKIIKITRLHDNNNAISKEISLIKNRLHKKSIASVADGVFTSAEFTFSEFSDYLSNMDNNECLMLGKSAHGESGEIVSSENHQNIASCIIRRTLKNFVWHEDYQLCCIDYDGSKEGDMNPEQVITILDSVMPGFSSITKVVKYSSSAQIYSGDGELLSNSNGFHIYFLVNHPDRIAAVFKGASAWLHKRLWIAGYGQIKNSVPKNREITAVRQMERTIYDNAVFSAERILFESAPILTGDLIKKNQEAFLMEGDAEFLDLAQYAPLSELEEDEYLRLVNQAKELNELSPYMNESKGIFGMHIRAMIQNGKYKNNKEYDMLNENQIVEKEQVASKEAILTQEHVIELDSGERVAVGEILRDPKKYHEQCCRDPHEPDYGDSKIAKIYVDQKEPIIRSYAHGGINYRLTIDSSQSDKPDYHSKEYVLEHFYLVNYDEKDKIYHINGNVIDKYSYLSFKHTFAGYKVEVSDGTNQHVMEMTKWWLGNIEKKCIRGDGFAPGKPILYEKYGKLVINEYVPEILHHGFDDLSPEKCADYAFPQISHIKTMIHDEREANILIQWFAFLVQCPNERPMFAPLISSEIRGVGKDMVTDIFCSFMGPKYARKSSIGDLSNESGWGDVFKESKLIIASECGSASDRYTIGNTIKDAITTVNKTMNIKGKQVVFGRVYAGIIFFSNSISPFRLDKGDRRFFVTRCDWSKEIADGQKEDGYFAKLASFYEEPLHLWGLYQYLLNKTITVDMKGDAPMTSTKEIMMESEHNETEQFFVDLRKHPCKYWTSRMIDDLFDKVVGNDSMELRFTNKQYDFHKKQMLDIKKKKLKIGGTSQRVKTFSMKDADMDNDFIRKHITEHQGITTASLHPNSTDKGYDDGDNEIGGSDIFTDNF